MQEKLWSWTAIELVRAIRNRAISSREAVQSSLDRIAAVNPAVNAVVEVLADEALAAADAADAAVKTGAELGPLHGVPVTTKVNADQRGCATTNGVVEFRNLIATEDSPVVANLRNAGAVIVGRTNTPAFSHRWFTDNDLHGATYNPWSRRLTPGGSSGGAATSTATLGNQQLTLTVSPAPGGSSNAAGACHAPGSTLAIRLKRQTVKHAAKLKLRKVTFTLGKTVKRAKRLPATARFSLRGLKAGVHTVTARAFYSEMLARAGRRSGRKLAVTISKSLRTRFTVC